MRASFPILSKVPRAEQLGMTRELVRFERLLERLLAGWAARRRDTTQ